jgi:hypothetical protein
MPTIRGDEVHGELSTTDASTLPANQKVIFYKDGSATVRAQLSTEFVTITDIIFISTAGGTYDLVFYSLATGTIADGAGLRIAKGVADAHGGLAHHFETPICGPVGYGVALIAAAGQVDLVVTGHISQA